MMRVRVQKSSGIFVTVFAVVVKCSCTHAHTHDVCDSAELRADIRSEPEPSLVYSFVCCTWHPSLSHCVVIWLFTQSICFSQHPSTCKYGRWYRLGDGAQLYNVHQLFGSRLLFHTVRSVEWNSFCDIWWWNCSHIKKKKKIVWLCS